MKKTKDRIVSIIALLVTVLYPCLFMYFQNVDEGNFKEIYRQSESFYWLLELYLSWCWQL